MSDNSKNLSSTKDLKRVLGFWDLMAVGIGSIIGSGIMSLTGWGIDETGRSVCIAFVIGGIIAVLARSPQIFLNSVARFRGGDYSMVGTFLGPRWTGTYSMIALLTSVTLCMYALSFADYAMPFLPNVSRKVIALSILTILFITNTFGINAFSKIQNAAVIVLVISLTAFTAVGLTKLDGNYFEPTQFMTHGAVGLWQASVLMSYTCDGAQYVTQMSGEAKNPTRDIPRVMLFSTLGVSVFYGLIGVVASGVLPVDQVAGQPMTVVSQAILSKPLYYLFCIGGGWMALLTTYRTPLILLGFYYVVGFVPIAFGIDIDIISNITITVGAITKTMIVLCLWNMPKVLPEAWNKSNFHISNGALKALCIVDLLVIVVSGVTSSFELPLPLLLGNLGVVVFAFLFGSIRFKSGKVQVEESYELS